MNSLEIDERVTISASAGITIMRIIIDFGLRY